MDERDPTDDELLDDDEDLVALADAASSRFATEAAEAAAAAAAAVAARADVEAVTPRRRPCAEDDDDEPGALLQYPSAAFPPPPVFRVRVPHGWVAVPVPEAELAVRRPEPIDGVVATVLVRVRRVAATVADDIRTVLAIDRPPADLEVLSDEVAADVTTPVRRLAVRYAGPDGGHLRARYVVVLVPATEHIASIVTIVATWPEAASDAVADEMEAVVRSLRVFTPRPS